MLYLWFVSQMDHMRCNVLKLPIKSTLGKLVNKTECFGCLITRWRVLQTFCAIIRFPLVSLMKLLTEKAAAPNISKWQILFVWSSVIWENHGLHSWLLVRDHPVTMNNPSIIRTLAKDRHPQPKAYLIYYIQGIRWNIPSS